MSDVQSYSAKSVYDALLKTFHQYLSAQYHIWDESLIEERNRLFATPGVTHQEPRIESTALYAAGWPYEKLDIPDPAKRILVEAARYPETGIPSVPYVHQAQAIEKFLGESSDLIVATGTGSGKTESFLMPILGQLAIEASDRSASWKKPGVRALLLYPMNALVNDQLARLRRLLGNEKLAAMLRGSRSHMATFGMYTSRTAYAGTRNNTKDKARVGDMLARLFTDGMTEENKKRLLKEGKWPAKDIASFVSNSYRTSDSDCEMFTRHEMQERAPDLLVTNYSMLEYMMLRPIEATIFEQTKRWLEADDRNQFTVVLDEAHMYRGSAGAEVAYLLRRLHSRLGVSRDRVRYILTSASLGSDDQARTAITRFAARLTGADENVPRFALVNGTLESRPSGRPATEAEQSAFAGFKYDALHHVETNGGALKTELENLARALGFKYRQFEPETDSMKAAAFEMLVSVPVANLVANQVTASPVSLETLAMSSFPSEERRADAMEALLALMAFAREGKTGKPFAPIRSHLFFRGLPGLFVCTNSACTMKEENSTRGLLGRLYASPRIRCGCGARVYELLTHRACGAAYIRGFLKDVGGDFLWHEPSTGVWSDNRLVDAQFFVTGEDNSESHGSGPVLWLATKTGQLITDKPAMAHDGDYLRVIRPLKSTKENGRNILTIESNCPACRKGSAGAPKAMDLATKGEAPFAHLVRTQVATQPRSSKVTPQSPNGGRKSLLFSDGRQKAARLARDIPRAIELDVFRQLLMLAAAKLASIGEEPKLSGRMYTSFLCALAESGLQLFDGDDREAIRKDVKQLERFYGGELKLALDEFESTPPRSYTALLLKQLCASNYSISALTLGFVAPTDIALKKICAEFTELDEEELFSLSVSWIQGLLDSFAFDHQIGPGIRRGSVPYPITPIVGKEGFSKQQKTFLEDREVNLEKLIEKFSESICEFGSDNGIYLIPKRVRIEIAIDKPWYQCAICKSVLPVAWWGSCSNCLSPAVSQVSADSTSYLRARKGFWRDPVAAAIAGTDEMVNLAVEEHTAQLSYKDVDEPTTTTEEFERRFRDILVRPNDTAIDVLSCTTTMEVGIDIGSLVAVGMRNVPPMRQNYQQRAGRAGRRGASISTVMTYAQNGAHDSYYFQRPDAIIGGEPPRPILDTDNAKIIQRHINAQLVQDFFRPRASTQKSGDIFSALGDTWSFYEGNAQTSFSAFRKWLSESSEAQESLARAAQWVPSSFTTSTATAAQLFVAALEAHRPAKKEGLEDGLINFLFDNGLLPSYAFPRDICSLQIERIEQGTRGRQVKTIERPQQSLNVALSEYAPGRLVVVNKETYRVGSVAANTVSTEADRAEALFDNGHAYVHCTECLYTAGFAAKNEESARCPHCGSESLRSVTVITPETVFPRGKKPIDEFDDEQQFSQTTGAQLPLADSTKPLEAESFGTNGSLAFQRQQPLVMVNMGASRTSGDDGFLVCVRCGRVLLDGEAEGPHERDYYVQSYPGRPPLPTRCSGEYRQVYLGYGFTSDVLLLRFKIQKPIRFGYLDTRKRKPIEDALQSLSEALVLSMCRVLDIDSREVSAGFRFATHSGEEFADIFVYDTLSGGAGYAYQAGDIFGRIFDEAEKLLSECDCDSSCEKCLRHYGNRFHHSVLDRNLAIDIARYIRYGTVPDPIDQPERVAQVSPLAQMLELAGWSVEIGSASPLKASRSGRVVEVQVCPSLIDCEPKLRNGDVTSYVFTPYELSRDLASAYAELA